jgi:hypothetical protein
MVLSARPSSGVNMYRPTSSPGVVATDSSAPKPSSDSERVAFASLARSTGSPRAVSPADARNVA